MYLNLGVPKPTHQVHQYERIEVELVREIEDETYWMNEVESEGTR
jgi:hypothetical protein